MWENLDLDTCWLEAPAAAVRKSAPQSPGLLHLAAASASPVVVVNILSYISFVLLYMYLYVYMFTHVFVFHKGPLVVPVVCVLC